MRPAACQAAAAVAEDAVAARNISVAAAHKAGTIAAVATAKPAAARAACDSVSRDAMRLNPSSGLSRSSFADTADACKPPVCSTLAAIPATAALPTGTSAIARAAATGGHGGVPDSPGRERATNGGIEKRRHAGDRSGRSSKGQVGAQFARPRDVAVAFRFFDALRRRFERLFRIVVHGGAERGIARIGATACCESDGTATAVAITAAANASGNASVKLPKRGTARDSAPSATCTTNARPMAGAATATATATMVAAMPAAYGGPRVCVDLGSRGDSFEALGERQNGRSIGAAQKESARIRERPYPPKAARGHDLQARRDRFYPDVVVDRATAGVRSVVHQRCRHPDRAAQCELRDESYDQRDPVDVRYAQTRAGHDGDGEKHGAARRAPRARRLDAKNRERETRNPRNARKRGGMRRSRTAGQTRNDGERAIEEGGQQVHGGDAKRRDHCADRKDLRQ